DELRDLAGSDVLLHAHTQRAHHLARGRRRNGPLRRSFARDLGRAGFSGGSDARLSGAVGTQRRSSAAPIRAGLIGDLRAADGAREREALLGVVVIAFEDAAQLDRIWLNLDSAELRAGVRALTQKCEEVADRGLARERAGLVLDSEEIDFVGFDQVKAAAR